MRFMIIVRASAESEAGAPPAENVTAQLAAFHEELARAGALLDASCLMPSAQAWRVRYDAGGREIITGPFPAERDLMGGYTLIEARSREEALEWARRFPNPCGDRVPCEIEVRELTSPDAFPPHPAVDRLRTPGLDR